MLICVFGEGLRRSDPGPGSPFGPSAKAAQPDQVKSVTARLHNEHGMKSAVEYYRIIDADYAFVGLKAVRVPSG